MIYLGIDLAWKANHPSAVACLHGTTLLNLWYVYSDAQIREIITLTKPDQIGVDAALEVTNLMGNRCIENSVLKDYAKYKLGILPINRALCNRLYDGVRGESLFLPSLGYRCRENLFEVYPHATILECFTKNHVLPYKRKKGRSKKDIIHALETYQNYLQQHLDNFNGFHINGTLHQLKKIEDILDAITCAYTLYKCSAGTFKAYDGLLRIPLNGQ